jgi:hypothetical protein
MLVDLDPFIKISVTSTARISSRVLVAYLMEVVALPYDWASACSTTTSCSTGRGCPIHPTRTFDQLLEAAKLTSGNDSERVQPTPALSLSANAGPSHFFPLAHVS